MPRLGVFAAALIAAAARAGANNGCSFCDESWEGGPGDGCYACDTAECGPDLCPDECPEQCPDGREFLCKTFSESSSVYVANLTSMTVGPDASGDACPAEWIQDTSIPYPTVPAGPCTGVFGADDARCVPSKCTGTPTDGGVPCPDRSTEGACSDASGCDWWPSCPKSLAPNATLGAESCIDSPPPFEGTCRETATGEASSLTDFNACAAVTALATADACNAVTFASGTVGTPCTYEPKDWRCYLHFTIAENLRGTPMVIGATPAGMVLKRCPLVGIPVVGEQYVFGITGPCAWRKGDFVALSEVPESFLPMMQPESPEQCPAVDLNGGGSTTLVILLIVVLPLGGIVLFGLLVKFCPTYFGPKKAAAPAGEEGGDVNPAGPKPAAP